MANLKRDSSGNYVVRFRLGGRGSAWVRENLGPVSHTDAKRLARELEARLKTTRPGARAFLTFGELAGMYLEERKDRLTPRGLALAEMIVRCHLKPFFGARRVADLRAADVEAYREQRRELRRGKKDGDRYLVTRTDEKIAPATFNREWSLIRAILNFGERTERIDRSPIKSGAVEKLATKSREAFFEPAEWAAFLAAAVPDPELRAAVPVMRALLLTASRIGEIVDLRWKDVNLRQKVVMIRQPKVSKREPRPKSLPIVPELEALLPEVRGFGEALVFRQIDEKPWTVPALQSAFERILRRAALEPAHGHLTPHSIRHTASTWAVRGGATPDEADRLRGITMKGMAAVYTHLQAADLMRAARALAAVEAEALAAGVTSVCSGGPGAKASGAKK
jgi:integrase